LDEMALNPWSFNGEDEDEERENLEKMKN